MDVIRKASITLMLVSLLAAGGCTTYQAQGGLVGGAVGGLAGALIDHRNPWRGGVIGAGPTTAAASTGPNRWRPIPVPTARKCVKRSMKMAVW
jgi:hypothetical protein